MLEESDLLALLQAYIAGDGLARKVLVDALEEAGDPRAETVRRECIDWDALAGNLAARRGLLGWFRGQNGDPGYTRWLIDCARFGSTSNPTVAQAVRDERRVFLERLFPELEL
jgi:hypothetical protein